jgi:NTP pyrophosphatase (non-canonical NTP hydrolase)
VGEIKSMTDQIVKIFKEYDKQGTKSWTYDIAAHDLQYQIGILAKRVLQLKGFRFKEGLSDENIKNDISDELADVLAETLFIAHELDIDIGEAWNAMIESDKKKINTRSK